MCCASLLETVTGKSATSCAAGSHPEEKNEEKNKEKNNEIHLLGIPRARKIRRDDRGRATRNVRRMLCVQRPSARQRTSCRRSSSSASGDRADPVLEKRQSHDDGWPLCGNQGTTWRHSDP